MMLRAALLFPFVIVAVSGNPISLSLTNPPHTMIAENVLVSISEKGAVVTGRYRFRITPDAAELWRDPPYRLTILLPVPVPAGVAGSERITAEVHPVVKIKGAEYYPESDMLRFDRGALPKEAGLPVFQFYIQRDDLEPEFEVTIQYVQPIIKVEGRDMVYYVPYLPGFELYQKRMRLSQDSFLVAFETLDDTSLTLVRPVATVAREAPKYIAIRPQHLEVIGVERQANKPVETTSVPRPENRESLPVAHALRSVSHG